MRSGVNRPVSSTVDVATLGGTPSASTAYSWPLWGQFDLGSLPCNRAVATSPHPLKIYSTRIPPGKHLFRTRLSKLRALLSSESIVTATRSSDHGHDLCDDRMQSFIRTGHPLLRVPGRHSSNLALRRAWCTPNLCKYYSRILSHQRTYVVRSEMAVAKWTTSVISTLSSDTEPTILVTFDNAKYVFNAGENTGRAWIQGSSHWRKVKALFFTQVGTQRMSGMPGTVLLLTRCSILR